jgi:cell division protein FtsZ
VVAGADMVFITAGMGGGTGTGAAPVIAQIAKEAGALTVAVVTKPFPFEGPLKMKVAGHGIADLAQHVDSIITIPNEKLALLYPKMSILNAFKNANNVLLGAVQGIAELITQSGVINVDFADVRTVMSEMGLAMMGSGAASGPDRAREAAEQAIHSPLLEDVDIKGARGVLVNVKGGPDLAMDEFQAVGDMVREFACEDAKVKVGLVIDPDMTDELRVTMVVTGIGAPKAGAKAEATRLQVVPGFKKASGDYDYATLEKPAYTRQPKEEAAPGAGIEARLDYLDIPAFLRRQAD